MAVGSCAARSRPTPPSKSPASRNGPGSSPRAAGRLAPDAGSTRGARSRRTSEQDSSRAAATSCCTARSIAPARAGGSSSWSASSNARCRRRCRRLRPTTTPGSAFPPRVGAGAGRIPAQPAGRLGASRTPVRDVHVLSRRARLPARGLRDPGAVNDHHSDLDSTALGQHGPRTACRLVHRRRGASPGRAPLRIEPDTGPWPERCRPRSPTGSPS